MSPYLSIIRTLNLQRVNAERHKHMDEIEVLKRQLSEMQREVEEEREQRIKLQKCASACMRRNPTAHPRAPACPCARYTNRLKADLQSVSDELESTHAQSAHVQSRAKLKASLLSESALGARPTTTTKPAAAHAAAGPDANLLVCGW